MEEYDCEQQVPLNLPAGCVVRWNNLYYDLPPCEHGEDVLLIETPGGVNIDAGWYGAFDPSGRFGIRQFGNDYHRPLEDDVEVYTVAEVKDAVEAMCRALATEK